MEEEFDKLQSKIDQLATSVFSFSNRYYKEVLTALNNKIVTESGMLEQSKGRFLAEYFDAVASQPELKDLLDCVRDQILDANKIEVYEAGIGLISSIASQPEQTETLVDEFGELFEIDFSVCTISET